MPAKVSIILPVYNVEKYLEKCLDSLCSQTLADIEIVAVNDGSTDSSPAILASYASKDRRIKIVNKANGGLSDARNAGLAVAEGEYISFIDSDDWIEVSMLETLVSKAQETNTDIVVCNYIQEYEDGRSAQRVLSSEYDVVYGREKIQSHIIRRMLGMSRYEPNGFYNMESFNCVWKNLYRRSLISGSNLRFVSEREYFAEDMLFNLSAYWSASSLVIVDKPLYHYRYNIVSLSNKYRDNFFQMFLNKYHLIAKLLEERSAPEEYKARLLGRVCFESTYVVANIFKKNNRAEKNEKQKQLQEVVNCPIVIEAFRHFDYSGVSLKYRVYFYLIKHRLTSLLFTSYSIKSA